jgi:hypothetical protein
MYVNPYHQHHICISLGLRCTGAACITRDSGLGPCIATRQPLRGGYRSPTDVPAQPANPSVSRAGRYFTASHRVFTSHFYHIARACPNDSTSNFDILHVFKGFESKRSLAVAMRLLDVETRQLEEFFGVAIPPYAILSHTWGKEEVTFRDLEVPGHQAKAGYAKIDGCCRQAATDGLKYVWIDTCCIDKLSSAELSEAINSMFRWYENSQVCYAYLEDVPPNTDAYTSESFRKSRWFTRGWTLQEMIAPKATIFFATDWDPLFDQDVSAHDKNANV